MNLRIFVKNNCEKCEQFKAELLPKLKEKYKTKLFNMDTVDGLTEAMFYNVEYPPHIILFEGEVEKQRFNSVLMAQRELLGGENNEQK